MKGWYSMANWEETFSKGNYRKVSFENILAYVDNNAPDYKETLIDSVKCGKQFLEIKKEFFKKYFPDSIPTRTTTRKSMKEWLGIDD